MQRSFMFLFFFVLFGCRDRNYSEVYPAPPELVEISLDAIGYRLSFLLPDEEWTQVEPDGVFKGLRYQNGGRSLRVEIILKEPEFDAAALRALKQADGAEIRVFRLGANWPFIGVIVTYRGPPDAALLDTFVRSFKVERVLASDLAACPDDSGPRGFFSSHHRVRRLD